MTSKLILTTDDVGAGHLKMARVASKVIAISHRLVWGGVPDVADSADFFDVRRKMSRAKSQPKTCDSECEEDQDALEGDWPEPPDGRIECQTESSEIKLWRNLLLICDRFDHIELWINPAPNDQLLLLQLLNRFGYYPNILAKLKLVQAETPLAERDKDDPATLAAKAKSITPLHTDLAQRAWQAFIQPTPEAWVGLLAQDLSALPHLHSAALELLQELPDIVTGIGATQMRILELIAPGGVHPYEVFPGHLKKNKRRVFQYWEVGRLLNNLACGPQPAVSGLIGGPFTLAMHDDQSRHDQYRRCELVLTTFGQQIVAGEADFSVRNPIDRWWGGTRLSQDYLWRWDDAGRRLSPPSASSRRV